MRSPLLILNPLLTFAEYDNGLIVEGIDISETIKGSIAQTVLIAILPLLTRGISIEDLIAVSPKIPAHILLNVIATLRKWHYVVEAHDYSGLPPIVSFTQGTYLGLGRYVRGAVVESMLKSVRVHILATPDLKRFADDLANLLQKSMIDAQRLDDHPSDETVSSDLTVVCAAANQIEVYQRAEMQRQRYNRCWLRLEIDEQHDTCDLGPYFDAGPSSCFDCFNKVHGLGDSIGISGNDVPAKARLLVGFACIAIVGHIAAIPSTLTDREFRRFNMTDWTSKRLIYPRFADCKQALLPQYSSSNSGHMATLTISNVYEDNICLDSYQPSHSWSSERAITIYRSLTKEFKSYPDAQEIELNPISLNLDVDLKRIFRGAHRTREKLPTLEELGAILALGAGIRGEKDGNIKRWISSAGNLGSIELFVLSKQFPNLANGIYFYQSKLHSLAAVAYDNRRDLSDWSDSSSTDFCGTKELIIAITAAHHRLAKKYGAFAYKLLHLDAGVAFSQISMVLRAMGISSRLSLDFNLRKMEERLDLQTWDEQAVATITLGQNSSPIPRVSVDKNIFHAQASDPFPLLSTDEICGKTSVEVEKRLFEEARTYCVSAPKRDTSLEENNANRIGTRFPRYTEIKTNLAKILDLRSSVREDLGPVSLGVIGDILKLAHEQDVLDWPNEAGLHYLIAARDINGLKPGIYEYNNDHYLAHQECEVSQDAFGKLFVQLEWSTAPCSIWIGASQQAEYPTKNRSYQKILFRAGVAAHRLSIAAGSQRLGATIVAGIVQGELRRLLNKGAATHFYALACVIGGKLD